MLDYEPGFRSMAQFQRWRYMARIHGPFCARVAGVAVESGPLKMRAKLTENFDMPVVARQFKAGHFRGNGE